MLLDERFLRLAVKRYTKRKANVAARVVVAGCVSLLLVGVIGFGIASAGGGSSPSSTFGLTATSVVPQLDASSQSSVDPSSVAREDIVLTDTAQRDMSSGFEAIAAQEEAERRAAEEAQRLAEEQRQRELEAAQQRQQEKASTDAASDSLSSLSEVNWDMSKEEFVDEWAARIDAYLAGSPLAGQGVTFATAAWDNGVDPRWSPAISNTESSKGAHCFLSHNAWGWGQSSWSSWEEAINAHVSGLAANYGYSITYSYAKKYCPPNYDHWFTSTLSEMKRI